MDPIKEAFSKVKQDIELLKQQINYLSNSIEEIKRTIINISESNTTEKQEIPTTQQIIPTDNYHLEALKSQNKVISTGNKGVPTDRQTNEQTDKYSDQTNEKGADRISQIEKVSQLLGSLDSVKKEIRSKFKKLTPKEMLIFSTIYQLEEQGFIVDYPLLASKLMLSESSVRDYVLKIIKKDIPIMKTKENNKKVILSIYPDFKKIAPLQVILTLRGL